MIDCPVVSAGVLRAAPARRRWTAGSWAALVLAGTIAPACGREAPRPASVRLVDVFDAKLVEGTSAQKATPIRRTEWRFDGAPPSPAPAAFAATRGWEAGPGVERAGRPRRPPGRPHDDRFPDPARRADHRASTTRTSSTRSRCACASRRGQPLARRPRPRRPSTSSRSSRQARSAARGSITTPDRRRATRCRPTRSRRRRRSPARASATS